ncbi:Hypothetical protein I5071_56570 [Sandaracinus amylolyticus]|nr:Hypothetical protein I5071_56570 [Sandaracinus amylolyticus]
MRALTQEERRLRLVLEALEVLADDGEAREIVADALSMAGRTAVPSIADGMRSFLSVHMLDAVEARLGADAADRFDESIDLVLRAAAVEHESAPAPRRGGHGRLVLVASSEPERVAQIARALSKHADVEAIPEPSSLPAMVWADLASAIVIDWARCPLDTDAIDELAAGMKTGGRLVLWGAPREVEARFLEIGRATWLSVARTAGAGHVAGIVLALLSDETR